MESDLISAIGIVSFASASSPVLCHHLFRSNKSGPKSNINKGSWRKWTWLRMKKDYWSSDFEIATNLQYICKHSPAIRNGFAMPPPPLMRLCSGNEVIRETFYACITLLHWLLAGRPRCSSPSQRAMETSLRGKAEFWSKRCMTHCRAQTPIVSHNRSQSFPIHPKQMIAVWDNVDGNNFSLFFPPSYSSVCLHCPYWSLWFITESVPDICD